MSGELDLRVSIAGVEWKNPVGTASGTFSAQDSGAFYDWGLLGAVTTKGVASQPWDGNRTPRIAETCSGMLNAVGLQNPGVEAFLKQELPKLTGKGAKVIVNLAGHSIEEYCNVAERLSDAEGIDLLELNISCPNVKEGGIGFGTEPAMAAKVTGAVKRVAKQPLIVKLTPNVTDIAEIAKAVEAAGADGLSLINTLLGMRIDLPSRRPVLANVTGGLSGPAVKPVAVRMVYQVRQAVKLPIIGLGGIACGEDAVEFLMAGADAVEVGSAALMRPDAPLQVLEGLKTYMEENGYSRLSEIREAFLESMKRA